MKHIGGYFELEVPHGQGPYHTDAIALTNGRACLRHALTVIAPRLVYLPYYTCNGLLEPITTLGLPFEWYSLDEGLEPPANLQAARGEVIIYINYFGLKGSAARMVAARFGPAAIIDDTQAFYEKGYAGTWSFNSARKFFGVPDGAYLYAPRPVPKVALRNEKVSWEHLIARLMGQQEIGYRHFVVNEAASTSEVRGMSVGAERLLAGIDYDRVARRRRDNYSLYHAALGGLNRLQLTVTPDAVPLCYPFLPSGRIARESLYTQGIYPPTYWKDCLTRSSMGFDRERDVADRLLPLPLDQRYDRDDIDRVINAVQELVSATCA
jgi:hypothetical protein